MYKVKNEDPRIIARFRDRDDPSFKNKSYAIPKKIAVRFEKYLQPLLNSNEHPFKKVEAILKFADKIVKESGVKDSAVCQKGCYHCCAIDVDVSLAEALYIADKYPVNVVYREKRIKSGYHLNNEYCGFVDHDTGECTIYDRRPLECRAFHAMDNPKYCSHETLDKQTGHYAEHMIYCSRSHSAFTQLMKELLILSDKKHCDIRDWFKQTTEHEYEGEYAKDLEYTVTIKRE